jgi:tetratricopeptide (TPR) repeat protein
MEAARQQKQWADILTDCAEAKENGEVQRALDLCSQVPPESSNYDRAQRLLPQLQVQADLDAAWSEAQARIDASDWEGAIALLSQIRSQNPDFHRNEVEQRLFELHRLLAFDRLDGARGNADLLREAIHHLTEALELFPRNQDLIDEEELAEAYVQGADAVGRRSMPPDPSTRMEF